MFTTNKGKAMLSGLFREVQYSLQGRRRQALGAPYSGLRLTPQSSTPSLPKPYTLRGEERIFLFFIFCHLARVFPFGFSLFRKLQRYSVIFTTVVVLNTTNRRMQIQTPIFPFFDFSHPCRRCEYFGVGIKGCSCFSDRCSKVVITIKGGRRQASGVSFFRLQSLFKSVVKFTTFIAPNQKGNRIYKLSFFTVV